MQTSPRHAKNVFVQKIGFNTMFIPFYEVNAFVYMALQHLI